MSKEIDVLEEAHRAAQGKKAADRIKTILLLNEGYSFETIAHILRLDDTTVRRYYKEFKERGIDGLLGDHYHGSTGFLSEVQERDLAIHLRAHMYQTVKAIVGYVRRQYNIDYSIEGMTHLLHRLRFVYKKTKVVPGKLDLGKQEAFKKEYSQIKASKKTEVFC